MYNQNDKLRYGYLGSPIEINHITVLINVTIQPLGTTTRIFLPIRLISHIIKMFQNRPHYSYVWEISLTCKKSLTTSKKLYLSFTHIENLTSMTQKKKRKHW